MFALLLGLISATAYAKGGAFTPTLCTSDVTETRVYSATEKLIKACIGSKNGSAEQIIRWTFSVNDPKNHVVGIAFEDLRIVSRTPERGESMERNTSESLVLESARTGLRYQGRISWDKADRQHSRIARIDWRVPQNSYYMAANLTR